MKELILAGGCFWGVEAYFQLLQGVLDTEVGYTDGPTIAPTYQEVCSNSGHAEACWIRYDETVLSLQKMLDHFFRIIDPTTKNRQAHDIGVQYRTAIFYLDPLDAPIIDQFLHEQQSNYPKPIQTYVKPAPPFFVAEEYHQDYLKKNPNGYCHVNLGLVGDDERRI